jgi:hypothetical protein
MPVTTLRGRQVLDGDITRDDVNTSTAGSAVITKVIAGTGISISSTGADAGTGDVTINAVNNGTVTSVGLALPAIFSVSNSPVTTSGTLTATLASQTANTFLAAPNGSAGVPSFRAIVAADVPTLNQNTTGSAATLTTARTINGTSFNGSANITTANWGTARTITIGSTGKSVDGSANISWTTAEIGAEFQAPAGVPRNNLGSPTVREMALFDAQYDNKTERHPIANVWVETSTDNVTWTDASPTDQDKRRLVGGDQNDSSLVIPYGTPYFRIRLRAQNYVYLNALYMYWSSQGHNSQVQIFKKHDSGAWTAHTSSSTTINSWPGHIFLPFASEIAWHPSGTLGNHFHEVYVLFIPTWNVSFPSNNIALYRMQWWGGYPAGRRNLYTTTEFGNAIFPGTLTATGLGGSLLSSATPQAIGTAAAGTSTIPARQDHVHPTTGLALLAGSTFTGQIISTRANDVTTGAAQIYLNGASGNRIDFNANGTSAPTFTTRSTGTKIVLNPSITATSVDTAIGYLSDAGGPAMWFSTVSNASGRFAFFGGQTEVFRIAATGQIQFSAGTAALPVISAGLANSGDSNTGIYFPTADTIGFVEGGVEAMRLDANARLNLTAGSAANPIINAGLNSSDTDTGIYFPAANSVSISTGGTERFNVNSSGVPTFTYADNTFQGVNIRNTSNTSNALNGLTIYDSANTAVGQFNYVNTVFANGALQNTVLINSVGNVKLGFVASSNIAANTNSDIYFQTGSTTAGRMIYVAGQAAMVGIGMGDTVPSAARLQVRGSGSTSSTTTLHVENSAATASLTIMDDGQIRVGAGSVSLPVISAGLNSSDTNTGIYFPAADAIAFATNGVRRVRMDNTGVGVHTDPSAHIHLSTDPATSKWLRIDATRNALAPDERNNGAPDTGVGSLVNNGKYLAEPNYWMEIYLGTNKVLVPCYTEGCGNCQLPGDP